MDLGLRGKVALVAASSRGLGRATAEEFGAEGVSLVMCARGRETLAEAAGAIRAASGIDVLDIPADVFGSWVTVATSGNDFTIGLDGQRVSAYLDEWKTSLGPSRTLEPFTPPADLARREGVEPPTF